MIERARPIACACHCVCLLAALTLPRVGLTAPPASEPAPASEQAPASEASVRAALAEGDPTLARELAIGLREAEPTLAHFELEADVHEQLGDYASAKRALRGALERVPEDDAAKREAITTRLQQMDERSRGVVADEPASWHRERLDAERAERLAALHPPPPKPEPVDVVPPPRVPIVKKWYFWVTLTTIVGTAVAITAVAIDANLDHGDAAGRAPGNGPTPSAGGLTLRF